jgi:superfamily II DNA or RNA helicase
MDVRVDSYAWLPKAALSASQIASLKSDLTRIPRVMWKNEEDRPKPVRLYVETETELGIAREFFFAHRRPVHKVTANWTHGRSDLFSPFGEFAAEPREEQQQCLQAVTRYLEDPETCLGGIIRAVPGWGKTVAGLMLAQHFNLPTLVLVHRGFLMKQWAERAAQFVPDAVVGIAQGPQCQYEGSSIVIGMIQSIVLGKYPREFYEWPGLIITDECHRVGAYTWSPAQGMFRARYRVGLTATPRRKDGMENAFYYHIGRLMFAAKEQRLVPKIRRVWSDFKLFKTERFNPNLAPRTLIIRFLLHSKVRNRTIVLQLIQAVQAGRKCLVVSEQLDHLDRLKELLLEEWPMETPEPTISHYVGGMNDASREVAAEAQVIFTTSHYSSEGLDIPALDTLFLTAPLSDVEQVVGRILRPHPDKKDPIVVDFRDDKVKQFKRQGEKRDAYYDQVTG